MQTIRNIRNGIKNILFTSMELITVRMDMARIEFIQQKERLFVSIAALFAAFIFMLTALISGLFALNTWLDNPQDKITAFVAVTLIALLIVFVLVYIVLRSLKRQRSFMSGTLHELKLDIAALKSLAQQANKSE